MRDRLFRTDGGIAEMLFDHQRGAYLPISNTGFALNCRQNATVDFRKPSRPCVIRDVVSQDNTASRQQDKQNVALEARLGRCADILD